MSLDDLKYEVNQVARNMQSYRKDAIFTELERALSLYCFGSFLRETSSMERSYVRTYDNNIARSIAINTVNKELESKEHVIQKHVPSFNRTIEVRWGNNTEDHEEWRACLTRALILLTRGLAYSYTGSIFDRSEVLNSCTAEVASKAATLWLSEIDNGFLPSNNGFANKFLKSFM